LLAWAASRHSPRSIYHPKPKKFLFDFHLQGYALHRDGIICMTAGVKEGSEEQPRWIVGACNNVANDGINWNSPNMNLKPYCTLLLPTL